MYWQLWPTPFTPASKPWTPLCPVTLTSPKLGLREGMICCLSWLFIFELAYRMKFAGQVFLYLLYRWEMWSSAVLNNLLKMIIPHETIVEIWTKILGFCITWWLLCHLLFQLQFRLKQAFVGWSWFYYMELIMWLLWKLQNYKQCRIGFKFLMIELETNWMLSSFYSALLVFFFKSFLSFEQF